MILWWFYGDFIGHIYFSIWRVDVQAVTFPSRSWDLPSEFSIFYGDFMVILWLFYDDFMVILWWFYCDFMVVFMVILWWFCGGFMVILWWFYGDFVVVL